MYNFYQSHIRKTINKDVAKKPVWDVVLFWTQYQYIIWEKKKRGISLNWIQILWIENIQSHTYKERQNELVSLVKKHHPIFIQLWSIDILSSYSRKELKDESNVEKAKDIRIKLMHKMEKEGFWPSVKENLPPGTYVVDLTSDWAKNISGQHNNKIKKSSKHAIIVSIATTHEEFEMWYDLLKQTAKEKWFWTISHTSYTNLVNYFTEKNTGSIYIAKIDNHVVAVAVYVKDYEEKCAVYLYWWTDRTYANRWASHLLHKEIYKLLQNEWFTNIDLLGGWPTWFPKHNLSTVSVFKEWFWGQKYDYIWSYDIVHKPIVYRIRKMLRWLLH